MANAVLSLAVPKSFEYKDLQDLIGKRIATTYPNILGKFFEENNVDAEIHTISGSVEIAPSIGLADAVCDLVSSGSTLFTNGLKEVETVMNSQAVLISRTRFRRGFADNFGQTYFSHQRRKFSKTKQIHFVKCSERKTGRNNRTASRNEKSDRFASGGKRLEFGSFGD